MVVIASLLHHHSLIACPLGQIIVVVKPSESVRKNRDEIVEIVLRHNAKNPRLFGSCSRNEDFPSSDIDLLIDPTETTHKSSSINKLCVCRGGRGYVVTL